MARLFPVELQGSQKMDFMELRCLLSYRAVGDRTRESFSRVSFLEPGEQSGNSLSDLLRLPQQEHNTAASRARRG